ncbi:death-associated protein 1 isoform X1 [Eumetopias jubatus]|uniref:Death-associated protein 1 isoform X1 n=1 Tax=Callorhinus ursinus TaxID=34884 RepID=A0A3Q7NPR8_CALUR|nr:death-associated protein 1 isoform X1 [Callorhinus ursinus]XP_027978452.1 death-associated protein 1 isoform X1 [Eumetopias jubatus]
MSSPPEGKLETKAGHPPAVKAGGMRIVQKHPHSGDTKEEKDKFEQEWESPRAKSRVEMIQAIMHSGYKTMAWKQMLHNQLTKWSHPFLRLFLDFEGNMQNPAQADRVHLWCDRPGVPRWFQ